MHLRQTGGKHRTTSLPGQSSTKRRKVRTSETTPRAWPKVHVRAAPPARVRESSEQPSTDASPLRRLCRPTSEGRLEWRSCRAAEEFLQVKPKKEAAATETPNCRRLGKRQPSRLQRTAVPAEFPRFSRLTYGYPTVYVCPLKWPCSRDIGQVVRVKLPRNGVRGDRDRRHR